MSAETELLVFLYKLYLEDNTTFGRFREGLPNNPNWRNVVLSLWEKGLIEGPNGEQPVTKGRITDKGITTLKLNCVQ